MGYQDKAARLQKPKDAPQELYADRVRVYPQSVKGRVRRIKWAVLIVCLGIYYLLPWLRWNRGPGRPDQALLLNLADERFYFFNLEFWPQDIYYLTGLLILGAVGLFLVTSVAGRIWCGYTCPQTVWTDLFMWVERLIEGDRNQRMRRDNLPWTLDTVLRKIAKHSVWVAIAFWTGGAWIMYYVDAPTVVREFWTGRASAEVYGFTALLTGTTYLLAGWAREQVCTYMCPWPRFQSAMLDEQSFIVTYQAWRGEPRGHLKHSALTTQGDCIDCDLCVNVCPTGVDIRNGIQLECIGCGLCADACNTVMARIGRDPGLITWDTLARQSAKAAVKNGGLKAGSVPPIRLLRPRTMIYAGAMLVAVVVMSVAMARRPAISLAAIHDRAPLFVRLADGSVRNGYTIKIDNKTQRDGVFELTMAGPQGAVMALAEANTDRADHLMLPIAFDDVGTFRLLVFAGDTDTSQDIVFSLRDTKSGETVRTNANFLGTGSKAGAPK